MNSEKLSSGERAEMRDLVTSGMRRMKAARARRVQAVAVAGAVVLVAAVVTTVSFAAFRPDDRVANPVPSTDAPTPTESADPEPTATESPVVTSRQPFDGICADAMTTDEASGFLSMPAAPDPGGAGAIVDSGVLGGISCSWVAADGSSLTADGALAQVSFAAYPASVVPSSVRASDGVVSVCIAGGDPCDYSTVHGEWWVAARAPAAATAQQAADLIGSRLANTPASAPSTSTARWNEPDCDALRADMSGYLGVSLEPYAGDVMPSGRLWDVLAANGAAAWCGSNGPGQYGQQELIELSAAPGSARLDDEGPEASGATRVQVTGATAAWFTASGTAASSTAMIHVVAEGNQFSLSARYLDEATMTGLAAHVLTTLAR